MSGGKNETMKALLVLEDGTVFRGRSFTGPFETGGEVVFNTSMTGYQEILTDPSYCGQMVTMTYPLIGNYGVNAEDVESSRVQVRALLVREYQDDHSNLRSQMSLGDYLREAGIPGMEGIDTRALTRRIRSEGAMRAALSTEDLDPISLAEKARRSAHMEGTDLVREVTCTVPTLRHEGVAAPVEKSLKEFQWPRGSAARRVVAVDFGIKSGILRCLERRGCSVLVVPAHITGDELDHLDPDGLFLSNGPGDPAAVTYAIEMIREQLGRRPTFGICLGHQLIALALGGKTFKLRFGHRGGNQPVKDLTTGRVEITSQNHGFCVDMNSIKDPHVQLTHVNLNDGTLEGLKHRSMPLFSVQYHPEASPGPRDADYLFDRFFDMMGAKR